MCFSKAAIVKDSNQTETRIRDRDCERVAGAVVIAARHVYLPLVADSLRLSRRHMPTYVSGSWLWGRLRAF